MRATALLQQGRYISFGHTGVIVIKSAHANEMRYINMYKRTRLYG
jgi:hypothetical protein